MNDQYQAAVEDLYHQHGRLTPGLVVAAARDKASVLHAHIFDRGPSAAAEAWYLHRAHGLIQSFRFVYREADGSGPEKSVRKFHALRLEDGLSYEPVENIIGDDFQTRLLLADMEREWRALKKRYEHFEEFWRLVRKEAA